MLDAPTVPPTPRRALVVASAVILAVRLGLALAMRSLVALPDEVGFLGNGWLLGRGEPAPPMFYAPVYKIGYPLLLGPVAVLTESPHALQVAARLVNVALLVALVPLLATLAGRLGRVDGTPRVLVAAAGACIPATWVAAQIAWPDAAAMVAIPALLVALWALATAGPAWRRVWFGPLAAWLWLAHDRFLPLLALCMLVLVARLVAPPDEGRRLDAVNLGLLVGCAAVGSVLNQWAVEARWDYVLPSALEGLSPGDLPDIAVEVVGQWWYLTCSTFGLALFGVASLAGTAVGGARRGGALWREPGPLVAATGLLVLLGTQAATAVQLRGAQNVDLLANGRYQDVAVPLLVTLGLARLGRWAADGRALRPLVAAGGTAVALAVVLAPSAGGRGEVIASTSISGIGRVVAAVPGQPVLAATVMALVGLAALGLLANRGLVPLAVAAALLLTATGVSEAVANARHSRQEVPRERLGERTRALAAGPVAYVLNGAGAAPSYLTGWELAGTEVVAGSDPVAARAPIVVTDVAGTGLPPSSRVAAVEVGGGAATWVRPGPVQRRLAAEGRLYPQRGQAVPAADRRVRIEPSASSVRAEDGHAELTVTVTNLGRGTVWPDPDATGWPAVSVRAADRSLRAVTAPVPELAPGESAEVTVDLGPLARGSSPVPVRLDVVEGYVAFRPQGARAPTVTVRP